MVTTLDSVTLFFRDYWRLMLGRPLLGVGPIRTSAEADARFVAKRFSRGSVAIQSGLFVSEQDMQREMDEVAGPIVRN